MQSITNGTKICLRILLLCVQKSPYRSFSLGWRGIPNKVRLAFLLIRQRISNFSQNFHKSPSSLADSTSFWVLLIVDWSENYLQMESLLRCRQNECAICSWSSWWNGDISNHRSSTHTIWSLKKYFHFEHWKLDAILVFMSAKQARLVANPMNFCDPRISCQSCMGLHANSPKDIYVSQSIIHRKVVLYINLKF